jgi:hypothetical protein
MEYPLKMNPERLAARTTTPRVMVVLGTGGTFNGSKIKV